MDRTGVWAMADVGSGQYKTLRLALAMRGGVSLAVWIGGAVAELDLFRRACNSPRGADGYPNCAADTDKQLERAKIYADLLHHSQFQDVEIDILAGASAGGLNAVLLGLAQSRGVVMDSIVRDTWIRDGGIWELLRKPGWRGVQSILLGDERLLPVIDDALRKIGQRPPDGPRIHGGSGTAAAPAGHTNMAAAQYISIELAATLLEDRHQPDRRKAAGFSFSRRPGGLSTDFSTIPGSGDADAPVAQALTRMALAARSTSSFPGAFEPATIYSYAGDDNGPGPNMSRCFPYARSESKGNTDDYAFDVVDGGIFDNIPIDRAIRAIQRSPASKPTERRLVYLDPEPPAVHRTDVTSSAKRSDRRSAASWIPVIRKSMALKQRSERAGDELALIRTHNDSVRDLNGRLEAFAGLLSTMQGVKPVIDRSRYVQCRIGTDAGRFARILSDPWTDLCRPPRASVDYGVLAAADLLQMSSKVADAYGVEAGAIDAAGVDLERDVYALVDSSRVLMAWLHAVEALVSANQLIAGSSALDVTVDGHKRTLYRCMALIGEARLRTVDENLAIQPMPGQPPELHWASADNDGGYCLTAALRKSWQEQKALTVPADLLTRVCAGSSADFYVGLGAWPAKSPEGEDSHVPDMDFRSEMWHVLEQMRVSVQRDTATVTRSILHDPDMSDAAAAEWSESVFPHFYSGGPLDVDVVELGKIFATTGVPSMTSIIEYNEITSDQMPTIAVPQLIAAARTTHLARWLKRLPEAEVTSRVMSDEDALMNADTKLAGNALSRFGGFFLSAWRENDWQWGRLDAASGIVKVLDDAAGGLGSGVDGGRSSATAIEALQQSIVDESTTSVVTTVGGDTLAAISPRYRFSLASRIVPLAIRACLPTAEANWSVGGIAARLGLVLARVVGVAAVLVADPLRLVWALVTVLAAATLMGTGTAALGVQATFYVIIIVAGVIMSIRSVVAYRRWKALADRVSASGRREWSALVAAADQRPLCAWSCSIGVVLTLGTTYLLTAVYVPGVPDGGIRTSLETFIVAMVAIVAGQYWLRQRARRLRPPAPDIKRRWNNCWGCGYRCVAGYAAVLAAAGVAVAANYLAADEHLPDNWGLGPVDYNVLVAAVGAAVLTALSVWGWVQNRWATTVVIGCGVLAAGAQQVLDNAVDHTEGWVIWDLLPAGVWLVTLAVAVGALPARKRGYGEPALIH